MGAYAASKHALLGLTKVAAAEVGQFGVQSTQSRLGPIDTRMFRVLEAERSIDATEVDPVRGGLVGSVPMGRCGTPAEVARVVAFLASEDSGFVNGAAWLQTRWLILQLTDMDHDASKADLL